MHFEKVWNQIKRDARAPMCFSILMHAFNPADFCIAFNPSPNGRCRLCRHQPLVGACEVACSAQCPFRFDVLLTEKTLGFRTPIEAMLKQIIIDSRYIKIVIVVVCVVGKESSGKYPHGPGAVGCVIGHVFSIKTQLFKITGHLCFGFIGEVVQSRAFSGLKTSQTYAITPSFVRLG